jgi:hypothetical protein
VTTTLNVVPTADTPVAYERKLATAIEIDLNVRVRGNETFARFEEAEGDLAVGERVQVYESESGLVGEGRVTEIDPVAGLVYLSVDWPSLHPGLPERHSTPNDQYEFWVGHTHGLLHYGPSVGIYFDASILPIQFWLDRRHSMHTIYSDLSVPDPDL